MNNFIIVISLHVTIMSLMNGILTGLVMNVGFALTCCTRSLFLTWLSRHAQSGS